MAAAASATAAWPPTLEHRFAQWLQTKPRGMDAPLAAAVAQHAHWLLRRLRAAGLGAATEEEEGARVRPKTQGRAMALSPPLALPCPASLLISLPSFHSQAPPSLVAHDGPSLQAYFHTHGLFPCPPSASHAAVRAADKTPGAQAVRALIAVGDAGWMRRQR